MMTLSVHCVCLLLVLLSTQDTVAWKWHVSYSKHTCATQDSSVNLSCSYTYPSGLSVKEVFWTIEDSSNPDKLIDDSKYGHRIEMGPDCGAKAGTCKITINQVTKQDEGVGFYCRIVTTKPGERWLGKPPLKFYVTALTVMGQHTAQVGDDVTFSCQNTCPVATTPLFTWFKDGRPVRKENDQTTTAANQLHLQPVSREDRGNYSCSLKGHEKYPSPALVLDVQYPPENVSLSVVPSTERMEGESVTLTCSSDANPPVHSYRWFKFKMDARHNPVESSGENEEQLNITNLMPTDGGSYYCEAENSVGVANSTEVSITVMEKERGLFIYILIGLAAFGIAVLLLALLLGMRFWKAKKKKTTDIDEYENQYNNVGIHGARPQGHAPGGSEEQGVNSNPANPRTNWSRSQQAGPGAGSSMDEALYATSRRSTKNRAKASVKRRDQAATGTEQGDTVYSNLPPKRPKRPGKQQSQEEEVQYYNPDLRRSCASRRGASGPGPGPDRSTSPPRVWTAAGGTTGGDNAQYSTIQPQGGGKTTGGAEGHDDVHYASIQHQRSRATTGGGQREDQVHSRGGEDDVQYSTVRQHPRQTAAALQGEEDVQYASLHLKGKADAKGYPHQGDEDNVIYSVVNPHA